jgi:hypothetical protein
LNWKPLNPLTFNKLIKQPLQINIIELPLVSLHQISAHTHKTHYCRSRSPSTSSRNRIHSEGNDEEKRKRRKKSRGSIAQAAVGLLHSGDSTKSRQKPEEPEPPAQDNTSKGSITSTRRHSQMGLRGDKLDLENHCLHCSLGTEFRRNRLRNEIESAVKRLARRLGNRAMHWEQHQKDDTSTTNSLISISTPPPPSSAGSHVEKLRKTMGTPDIVVSSISSDEEENHVEITPADTQRSNSAQNDQGSNYPTSGETRLILAFSFSETNLFSSACTTASPSPRIIRPTNDYFFSLEPSPTSITAPQFEEPPIIEQPNGKKPLQLMDSLKPPNFHLSPNNYTTSNLLSPSDSSNSPPRSNSVDLSMLRRDIELWSISSMSSGDQSEIGSESEFEPATPAESVRTIRSHSHDPTQSPQHILRRPSRIEHLSEIFR